MTPPDFPESCFVIGHYNDSPLFVGGDLRAAGYIPRAKPYRELPRMVPHQIAGRIEARRFDALDATDDALKAAFVDEVLGTGRRRVPAGRKRTARSGSERFAGMANEWRQQLKQMH